MLLPPTLDGGQRLPHGARCSAQCRLRRGRHVPCVQAPSQAIDLRFADELCWA